MIEVVSLVNFDNTNRVKYLQKSFSSLHSYYGDELVHHVFDSSENVLEQKREYDKLGVNLHHMPGASYTERLKCIKSKVSSDFVVFLPDDYVWIFNYPLLEVIEQARKHDISQVKLSCRGMSWFAQESPQPVAWFENNKVISGEVLIKESDLFVSKRRWIRDFHEQFSLGCTISNVDFLDWVSRHIYSDVYSPGAAEKRAYLSLVVKRYYTAYYKMQVPAFHFAEYAVEGDRTKHTLEDMLIESNYAIYNKLFNKVECAVNDKSNLS